MLHLPALPRLAPRRKRYAPSTCWKKPLPRPVTSRSLVAPVQASEPVPARAPPLTQPPPRPEPAPTPDAERPDSPIVASPDTADPETLIAPGYVLDEVIVLALDAVDPPEILVISHTARAVLESGDPSAAPVPRREDCTRDPQLEFHPSACHYRAEIFAWDSRGAGGSAWLWDTFQGGVQSGINALTFRFDSAGREAAIITAHTCTGVGSGCGDSRAVLTMIDGVVKSVYGSWKGSLQVGPTTARISVPRWFGPDPFCCNSGFNIDILGLDPTTGELGVIASDLSVCTQGRVHFPEFPPDVISVGCTQYRTTTDTEVVPATVGGLGRLEDGEFVRVEFTIEECPDLDPLCMWPTAVVATRITVGAPTFRALSDVEIDLHVRPFLRDGDQIAHAVFEGPFGLLPDTVLAILDRGVDGYAAVVVSDGRAVRLDRLRPAWAAWDIPAILFEDVDGDGTLEAIILAQYITGAGPTGAVPFFANSVLEWTGAALVTLPDVEERILQAETSAQARALLP